MMFRKARFIKESDPIKVEFVVNFINNNIIDNGVVDLTNVDYKDVVSILSIVEKPVSYCSSDLDMVNYVRENSIYKIRTLINDKNIKDILDKSINLINGVEIDIENLSNDGIDTLIKLNVDVKKYYSTNIIDSIFVNVTDKRVYVGDNDDKWLEKISKVNKNSITGSVKCSDCPAYGICTMYPRSVKFGKEYNIGRIIDNDIRCYKLQELADRNKNKVVEFGVMKNVLKDTSEDLESLRKSIENNNMLLFEITNALEEYIKMNGAGGNNE